MSYRRTATPASLRAVLLVAACSALAACGGTPIETSSISRLRFANAFAAGRAVNVSIDGRDVATAVPFRSTTALALVESGTHVVTVTDAGSGALLLQERVSVGQNSDVTLIGAGTATDARAITLVDDPFAAAPSAAQARFVNAIPDAGSIDVFLAGPGVDLSSSTTPALVSNVAFGGSTSFVPVSIGNQRLVFTAAGQPATVLSTDNIAFGFDEGRTTTFVATPGIAGVMGPGFALIEAR